MSTFRTFKEYLVFKEGATIKTVPGSPGVAADPDEDVDKQIMANPQMLNKPDSKNPAKDKKIVTQAIQTKNQTPNATLDAAVKASQIKDRLK